MRDTSEPKVGSGLWQVHADRLGVAFSAALLLLGSVCYISLAVGLSFPLASRLAVVAGALGFVMPLWRRYPGGAVTRSGVVLFGGWRLLRRVAWSEVTAVELGQAEAVIVTPERRLRLTFNRNGGWLEGQWARACWEQAHGLSAACTEQPEVPPTQIREWLGLQDGETLSGKATPRWSRLLVWPALAVVVAAYCQHREWELAADLSWQIAVLESLVVWLLVSQRFTADEHGLRIRSLGLFEVRFDWSRVLRCLRGKDRLWVADGSRQAFLHGSVSNLDRLAAGIDRIVAERQAGAVLPRLDGGVSDAALSRAEPAAAADHSLSRSSADS